MGGINIYGPNMAAATTAALNGINQQYGQYGQLYQNYVNGINTYNANRPTINYTIQQSQPQQQTGYIAGATSQNGFTPYYTPWSEAWRPVGGYTPQQSSQQSPTFTPGLTGAVDGISNYTPYNGGYDMGPQTQSPSSWNYGLTPEAQTAQLWQNQYGGWGELPPRWTYDDVSNAGSATWESGSNYWDF